MPTAYFDDRASTLPFVLEPDVRTPLPRVALVTSGCGPRLGGVGVVSSGISNALARHADVRIWRHRPEWPPYVRRAGLVLRALAGSLDPPDFIVFTHVDLARVALMLPFLRTVPYAVFIHGTEVWLPLDRWRRACLEHAAAILTSSDYTEARAREANPWLPDVKRVWLGTEERTASESTQRTPTVLILSRMASADRYKGHEEVIAAWPRVLAAVPGAKLIITGEGDDRRRLEARAAGVDSITFTGFVGDDERDHLFRSSALLVSISTGEGFGLAALEAAACGLPVVGLKGTVIQELFPDSCGHVLLDSVEPQTVANALIGLLTDHDLSNAIGEAGRQRMREAFTIGHFNQRIRAALMPLFGVHTP